jgi:hypothetical protein
MPASLQVEVAPLSEPVSLQLVKTHLNVTISTDDTLLNAYIQAARELVETYTGRSFINKGYLQQHDFFPYFSDRSQTMQAPAYYAASPRYATTQWNYSQMIKLQVSPLVSVESIKYTKPDNTEGTLAADTDFVVDKSSEPPRLFPMPGGNWPATLNIPNAVRIHFTAGSAAIPGVAIVAMLQAIANWYRNRENVTEQTLKEIPNHFESLLWSIRIIDFAPTPG